MAHEEVRKEVRYVEKVEGSEINRIKKEIMLIENFEKDLKRVEEIIQHHNEFAKKDLDDRLRNRGITMSAKAAVKHNPWRYLWEGVFKEIKKEQLIPKMEEAIIQLARLDKGDIIFLRKEGEAWNKIKKETKEEYHDKIALKLAKEESRVEKLERRHLKFARRILPLCSNILHILSNLNYLCGEAGRYGISGPDFEASKNYGVEAVKYTKALQKPSKLLITYIKREYRTEIIELREEKKAERLAA